MGQRKKVDRLEGGHGDIGVCFTVVLISYIGTVCTLLYYEIFNKKLKSSKEISHLLLQICRLLMEVQNRRV